MNHEINSHYSWIRTAWVAKHYAMFIANSFGSVDESMAERRLTSVRMPNECNAKTQKRDQKHRKRDSIMHDGKLLGDGYPANGVHDTPALHLPCTAVSADGSHRSKVPCQNQTKRTRVTLTVPCERIYFYLPLRTTYVLRTTYALRTTYPLRTDCTKQIRNQCFSRSIPIDLVG